MEETENKTKPEETSKEEEKVYSESELDEIKLKLQEEFNQKEEEIKKEAQSQIQKSGMSELEIALSELEEMKKKYQEKEDECTRANEKEQTLKMLQEADISPIVLDLVYEFKDLGKTKANIETLKTFLEAQKQEILKIYSENSPSVEVSKNKASFDPFIEGFDSNRF